MLPEPLPDVLMLPDAADEVLGSEEFEVVVVVALGAGPAETVVGEVVATCVTTGISTTVRFTGGTIGGPTE